MGIRISRLPDGESRPLNTMPSLLYRLDGNVNSWANTTR